MTPREEALRNYVLALVTSGEIKPTDKVNQILRKATVCIAIDLQTVVAGFAKQFAQRGVEIASQAIGAKMMELAARLGKGT